MIPVTIMDFRIRFHRNGPIAGLKRLLVPLVTFVVSSTNMGGSVPTHRPPEHVTLVAARIELVVLRTSLPLDNGVLPNAVVLGAGSDTLLDAEAAALLADLQKPV